MPSSVDWARSIGTTLVTHLAEEEQATFRKFKVFAALEGSGNVTFNSGGRGFDWQVRYRNVPVSASNGETPKVFSRHNLWQRAYLPYRGYSVTDQITKREMLENRGAQALIDVAGKMSSRLQESMQEHLAKEIYIDGNLPANDLRWHGLESIFATDGSINVTDGTKRAGGNAADPFLYPLDTYAGLSTELGGVAGGLRQTGSWPFVDADPEYDYYSPIVCNAASTYFTGSSWGENCIEALRLAVNFAKRNDTKEDQIDMILMDRALYVDFLNKLDSRERAIVTKTNGLRSYGFGDVVEIDGIEAATEYSIPKNTAYGLSIGNMEMRVMTGSLMEAEGPFYNEELSSYRYSVSVLANLKMKSPRNFVKWVA